MPAFGTIRKLRRTNQLLSWLQHPAVVVLCFIVLIAPFALQYHFHYPDEMYYTDGAIIMQQSGDYFTPKLADEGLRFNKPILTYYFVLAGHKLFGISPFSSRIFFLLAGGMTVALVFLIAFTLTGQKKTGILSALVAATHPTLILSSTRSIPDILLALFLTLAGLGVAGLAKYGNQVPKKYLWFLYSGLALAFGVKGLPAIALGGLALLYLMLNPWQPVRFKTFLHWPSIVTSLLLAFWWFGLMFAEHGPSFLDQFLDDQVGVRFSTFLLRFIEQLVLATLLLLVMFFPWITFIIRNGRSISFKKSGTSDQLSCYWGFVAIWAISIILMSASVTRFYERYLLPVIPVASVWAGTTLSQIRFERQKLTKSMAIFLIVANCLIAACSLLMLIQLDGSFLQWSIWSISIVMIGFSILFIRIKKGMNPTIAANIWLLFFSFSLITGFISLPDQGQQTAEFLRTKPTIKNTTIGFCGNPYHGSRIRIGLGNTFNMVNLPEGTTYDRLEAFDYLIVDEKTLQLLPEESYQSETITVNWDNIPVFEIATALISNRFSEVFEQNAKSYYWVEKRSKGGHP